MEAVRALVVDDEEGIRYFLQATLEECGYRVDVISKGETALEVLRETAFDLVLLDLNLGGRVDGLRVLEAIKWRWPKTIVLILTAYGSLGSAMEAIREGVDGYLLKPVKPNEVVQAVQEAFVRRERVSSSSEDDRFLSRGPFFIDLGKHVVTLNGRSLELTTHEFRLLVYLVQNSHRVVPPRELVRAVRRYECQGKGEARRIIKWYIHRLRQKVEPDPSDPRYVINVRGVGYRFEDGTAEDVVST